jgi:hypothetical protein
MMVKKDAPANAGMTLLAKGRCFLQTVASCTTKVHIH